MANAPNDQSGNKEKEIGSSRSKSGAGSTSSIGSSPMDSEASIGSSMSSTSSQTSSVTDAADRFTKTTGSGSGAATATARSFYDQAKETAGQAYDVVSEKAVTKIDEQKSTLSGGISTVADSIRQVGDNLGSSQTDSGLAESAAKYTQTAAQKLEDVAGYFETKSVKDMARDLEGFARRNPIAFLGAAFGLGLIAARFLKSGSSNQFGGNTGGQFERGTQMGSMRGDSPMLTGEQSMGSGGDSTGQSF